MQKYSEFIQALTSGGAPTGPNGIMELDQATIDAINLENVQQAIAKNINLDPQGNINTFDISNNIPEDNDLDAYSDSELMESDTTSNRGILELLKSGAGNVVDYIKGGGIIGKGIMGVTNILDNMFSRESLSRRNFNAMTPGQQQYTSSLYNPGGLLEGYNQTSAYGQGAIGTLSDRLGTIQNTLDRQGTNRSSVLEQREQQIKDAIDNSINIGEREALADPNRSVQHPGSNIRTRTDIDVADGGAETSGNTKIVCTMMNESYGFGSFRNKIWMKFHKDLSPEYQKGYHKIFLPLVKLSKTNKVVKKVLEHIAVHSTIDMRQATRGKTHLLGRVYRKILLPLCYWVGKNAK